MKDTDVYMKLSECKLLPVIVTEADKAELIAKALIDGGLNAAEITFREKGAELAIKNVKLLFPDMLVGAGTVLNIEQADMAVEAGADFIVSPGLNPSVVSYCVKNNITIIPGCMTPGEIEHALSFGLNAVKFFPAEQAGGVAMLKALSQPYMNLKFLPTGGINLINLRDYLSFDRVLACGGSFMVKDDYIKNGAYEKITELTKMAVDVAGEFVS